MSITSDTSLWSVPTLDSISLYDLKKNFDSVTNGLKISDYLELSPNLLSYIFSICENKDQPDRVKFHSVSLLQRYLHAKN